MYVEDIEIISVKWILHFRRAPYFHDDPIWKNSKLNALVPR